MSTLSKPYRDIIPNFDDPKAVIREYYDNSTGELQKVEIFYDGKYGGDSEGHGHWVAENIDGLFQVTLDRNPDKVDGGRHIIEALHDTNAYNDELRLERIQNKENVIAELQCLTSSVPGLGEKVKLLRDKFYQCGSCGHEDNVRLKNRFDFIAQSLFDERQRRQQDAKIRKEAVVSQAETLSYSTDFKNAKDQMRSLREQWKQLPRASRQDEDELWRRFQKAIDRLFENAKRDFEQKQAQQQAAKGKKENIIRQAEQLVGTSDFRAASDEMKRLSDEFYNAGSAGKDNQALKEQFHTVKERFYAAKKQAYEQKHADYLQNLQERIYRKRESLNRLESAIYNKENQLSDLYSRPEPGYNNPHRWDIIARRNEKESSLRTAIADMKSKREAIISQLSELESKLRSSC